MDLRAGLDGEDAGNTWLIIALYFGRLSRIYNSHLCWTGAIRVRERVMDLRVILDKGAAGNTYRIIKLYLVHFLLSLMPDRRY